MSRDTALRALHELHRLGCRIIMFEGGEPLLWRDGPHDFSGLARYARKLFLRVGVTTNGTLPLSVPTDVVWVSIDGLPATHNLLRSDSFERIWHNLKTATHRKIFIHFTMHRKNWQELEALLRKLREVPAVRGVTVQLFYPYAQGEEDLSLSAGERRAALENALRLKQQGHPVLNSKSRLTAMIENTWRCRQDILINVDPDGSITRGCYVKSRGTVNCSACGFTPVAEASGALWLNPGSILAGWRIFIAP
jgi:MoaA/NifB/PqqE/SkfB family radical SAM enzyme